MLALLVMLVLSGLGLVAMHSTSQGTSLAGMHRLQGQSKSMSDAVNQLGVMRSGRDAQALHVKMRNQAMDALDFGAMRRGGFVLATTDYTGADEEVDLQTGTGLFSGGDFVETVDEEEVIYRYIVRDPVMGPPVPGFDDSFCFIGVSIASWANLGRGDPSEDVDATARSVRPQALGRNVSQAFIGPIECS